MSGTEDEEYEVEIILGNRKRKVRVHNSRAHSGPICWALKFCKKTVKIDIRSKILGPRGLHY